MNNNKTSGVNQIRLYFVRFASSSLCARILAVDRKNAIKRFCELNGVTQSSYIICHTKKPVGTIDIPDHDWVKKDF